MKLRILPRLHLCRFLLLCILVELLPFHANAEGISLRQRHQAEAILAGRRHFRRANHTIDTTAPADSSSRGAFTPDNSAADSQTSNNDFSNNNAGNSTSDSTSDKSRSDNFSGSTHTGTASNHTSPDSSSTTSSDTSLGSSTSLKSTSNSTSGTSASTNTTSGPLSLDVSAGDTSNSTQSDVETPNPSGMISVSLFSRLVTNLYYRVEYFLHYFFPGNNRSCSDYLLHFHYSSHIRLSNHP
jgi:hypothetical protein